MRSFPIHFSPKSESRRFGGMICVAPGVVIFLILGGQDLINSMSYNGMTFGFWCLLALIGMSKL